MRLPTVSPGFCGKRGAGQMKDDSVANRHLAKVYAKSSVEEKRSVYRDWAKSYDQEVETDFGYIGPREAVRAFCDRVPDRNIRLLDAGCGTGLVGRELNLAGYGDIHGVDFSPEMLAEARALGVYASLSEADLTRPLQVEQSFDAAISVGLYGFGPPHIAHLGHVVGATKPGALSLLTVNGRGWEQNEWQRSLPGELKRQDLELVEEFEIDYLLKEGIKARVLLLRQA